MYGMSSPIFCRKSFLQRSHANWSFANVSTSVLRINRRLTIFEEEKCVLGLFQAKRHLLMYNHAVHRPTSACALSDQIRCCPF